MTNLNDLQQIREFVQIAEAGSISAAAKILSMGQPTLSRHLAALETQIGAPLIRRDTHTMSLTEAGRIRMMPAAFSACATRLFLSAMRCGCIIPPRLRMVVWHRKKSSPSPVPHGGSTDWLLCRPRTNWGASKHMILSQKATSSRSMPMSKNGSLSVEALDATGQVIPGYDKESSVIFKQDSVKLSIRWKDADALPAGKPIRLRFHLENGDLYSYLID